MARIISVNDTVNVNTVNNEDDDDDFFDDDDNNQKDSDDEYINNGTPISNKDIENELLFESFSIGNYYF